MQVGVLSTMCHCVCVWGVSWQGEWARALARRAAESLCAPMCRSSLSNGVMGTEFFCLYVPMGQAFLRLGPHRSARRAMSTEVFKPSCVGRVEQRPLLNSESWI